MSVVDLKNCVQNDSFSMSYSLAYENLSHKSLQCAKNKVHVLEETSCRVRTKDRAAAKTSKENGYGANGSSKRPQARALDFLHTCERAFQMQGCMTSKMSRF